MDDMEDDKQYSIHRLRGVDDDMDFIFSNLFNTKFPILLHSEKRWHPPTDVLETDDEFIVVMDIANVKQDDIRLTYEAGILTVNGHRHEMKFSEKRHYHKMEIDFGPFERRIKVNTRIQDQAIKAGYENGFLIVRLKKDTSRSSRVTNIVIE
ncbi:MAG TPA: Hsp20/alpha crystallin family protein [bacterium]|nr:Hsp20/alpha crystallin family protein [bacterium]